MTHSNLRVVATRVIYIDDSGSEAARLNVFGWVEVAIESWKEALQDWLDWRRELYRSIGIPTDYELHATKFAGGRGRPTGTAWDTIKSQRAPVITDALRTLVELPGLSAGAAFQRTDRGTKHHLAKADTYARLVRHLDARLTANDDFGLVVMDGEGTDPSYRAAHRELKLDARSLIEDPFFLHSHHSQWVQMADLVAYAAYMRLERIPAKSHTWQWYDIIAASACTGHGPLDLKAP
ncbi:DUF3800 domain-containing protein [Saccharopolyspora sp. NPDC002376]